MIPEAREAKVNKSNQSKKNFVQWSQQNETAAYWMGGDIYK